MWRALFLSCFVVVATIGAVKAQQAEVRQSQILVIDTDQLFSQSLFGQRVAQELEAESRELAAENRRIEGELAQEEQDLTNQRATMSAEDFRVLADAFDEKVQTIRQQQQNKTIALNSRIDSQRVTFLNAAAPILQELMRAAGAVVLMERRNVVLSAAIADITVQAVAQIDEVLGEGSQPATSGD